MDKKTATIHVTVDLSDDDTRSWYYSLTKDEMLDLGLILGRMKEAGAIRRFEIVHVHLDATGLSAALATLPASIQHHIPPPLA